MKVVVDTNIIFSILLSHSSKLRDILWNRKYTFYSPNFVFVEIFKHKEKIMKFTRAPEATVYEYLHEILKRINFVNIEIISDKNLKKAYELCKDVDETDVPCVALALELNALLWTGDKKLKEALKRRGFNRFFDLPRYESE